MQALQVLPLLFAFCGLVLYTVLGGADFGAGLWQLTAGTGPRARRIREHAHEANAPVWEANHVWLVFVLTVLWTAYPLVVGSVCSTLAIPLGLAAVGIILRALGYTLQTAAPQERRMNLADDVFAMASIVTPFMLGALLGGVASGRVPTGNAAGNLITSWVNPTSLLCGCLAVAVSGYLGAVYLSADARRLGDEGLEAAFRRRALLAGTASGILSIAGLAVAGYDAHRIYVGLVTGWGLVAVVVSGCAAIASFALMVLGRFLAARLTAALAVAAVLAGWAVAQRPFLLPGLTLPMAAADPETMVSLVVAVVVGAIVVGPSLGYLFQLSLSGRFDRPPAAGRSDRETPSPAPARPHRPIRAVRVAGGCLIAGFVLLTIAGAPAAHALGILVLAGAALATFRALDPVRLGRQDTEREGRQRSGGRP
jgi:cytochrome bd ubiquinol oxidase subunit II